MKKLNSNSIGNNLIKVDGNVIFKLQDTMEKRGFNKYRLSKVTNIRYDTICNYCKGNVTLINAEYLKIFCNVLDCKIEDILEYKK